MKRLNLLLLFILTLGFISGSFTASHAQQHTRMGTAVSATHRPTGLSDTALLELTEKQTFKYFWDFAHPTSGLARERSNIAYNYGGEVVTPGGSGFGIMAIVVGTERKWITREQAVDRLLRTGLFLSKADSYHGIFPHWLT